MSVVSRCLVVQRSSFSQHSTFVVTLVLAVVWLVLCADPICFVPRAVVSVDGLAQCAHTLPLVASHAQSQVTDGLVYIDELFIKRYFSSLFLSRRAPCHDNSSRSVGQWRWRWRR